jgi:hypothetical protein
MPIVSPLPMLRALVSAFSLARVIHCLAMLPNLHPRTRSQLNLCGRREARRGGAL